MPDLCKLDDIKLPDGLLYMDDFIDEVYAKEISDFLMNDSGNI